MEIDVSTFKGYDKRKGYASGLMPGIKLFHQCKELGVKELTYYGFTTDNTKRAAFQRKAADCRQTA